MTAKTSASGTSPARLVAAALLAISLALPGLIAPSPAHGDTAFLRELGAQNAHHFAKPLTLVKAKKPPGIEREWEEKLKRKSWKLSSGPLAVEITLKKGGPPDASLYVSPLLSLKVGGSQVLSVEGSESLPDNPIFLVQIAELDPGNPYPEVVFSIFTGGAHCCSDTRVLASSPDGKTWRDIEVGMYDGGPLGVSDLDGDGRYEFSMHDNAFLYTFSCYACSTAPFHVLQLANGKLVDASTAPAFRDRHVDALRRMVERADADMDINGFLAGYVAQKILLGEGAQAWKLMEKYYERKTGWGLETCSVKQNDKGECPPGKMVKLNFPDALERFLKEAGYRLEK